MRLHYLEKEQSMSLAELTIEKLQGLLEKREITPADILRDLWKAVESDNRSANPLNAYIRFDLNEIEPEAEHYLKYGDGNTPLGGIPIGVKDIINVKGTPTTCASLILKRYVSPYDATAVSFLKKNGGIPAGKLNMDEFAMGSSSEHSAFGAVRNPYDRGKIAGGSSGGAAAAVAGNLAVAALGSDTGGSIRQPASMCGVFGIKPTYGRVSRYGLVAYASSFDQIGTITKSVKDGALLLKAISGYDPKDSTSAREEVQDFPAAVGKGVRGLKIGIPEEYFDTGITGNAGNGTGSGLDGEVRALVERAVSLLEEAGAVVKKINLLYTKYAIATYYIIATAEASSNLARFDGIRYGGKFADGVDLDRLYKENRRQGFGSEVKRRILLGTFTLSSGYYDAYYLKAQRARTVIREDFKKAFRDVELIAAPVSPVPAWDIGKLLDDPLQMYLADIYTVPVNLAGLPAASVPCGNTAKNLPVGLQLIGNYFMETDIFRAARVVEERMQ